MWQISRSMFSRHFSQIVLATQPSPYPRHHKCVLSGPLVTTVPCVMSLAVKKLDNVIRAALGLRPVGARYRANPTLKQSDCSREILAWMGGHRSGPVARAHSQILVSLSAVTSYPVFSRSEPGARREARYPSKPSKFPALKIGVGLLTILLTWYGLSGGW